MIGQNVPKTSRRSILWLGMIEPAVLVAWAGAGSLCIPVVCSLVNFLGYFVDPSFFEVLLPLLITMCGLFLSTDNTNTEWTIHTLLVVLYIFASQMLRPGTHIQHLEENFSEI